MSYLTVEVEIDHGRIIPRDPGLLPEKGSGLLTILRPSEIKVPASSTLASRFPPSGLHPTPRTEPRPVGLAKGEFVVPKDFNAPLPEEELRAFEPQ